jgi:hypothetical protein
MSGRRLVLVAAGLTLLVVAVLGAVSYLVADRCCPTHTGYFSVRLGPGTQYHFRVQGSELRMARSLEGLRTAAPVRATSAGENVIAWASTAELAGARGSGDWENVQLNILTTEPLPKHRATQKPSVLVDLGLPAQDREGHRWVYWVRSELPVQGDPKAAPLVHVPRQSQPSLTLAAFDVPLHSLGLVFAMKLGGLPVVGITRDGQPARLQVAVYDEGDRLVETASGGIGDFGSDGDTPIYAVSVRRNHPYTAKATLEAGPLGRLTTSSVTSLAPHTTRNQGYCPSLPCTP